MAFHIQHLPWTCLLAPCLWIVSVCNIFRIRSATLLCRVWLFEPRVAWDRTTHHRPPVLTCSAQLTGPVNEGLHSGGAAEPFRFNKREASVQAPEDRFLDQDRPSKSGMIYIHLTISVTAPSTTYRLSSSSSSSSSSSWLAPFFVVCLLLIYPRSVLIPPH